MEALKEFYIEENKPEHNDMLHHPQNAMSPFSFRWDKTAVLTSVSQTSEVIFIT